MDNDKTIELRLEGVRYSLSRSRYAFLASIIASVTLIIAGWNAYLSWERTTILTPQWYEDEIAPSVGGWKSEKERADFREKQVTTEADRQAIGEWVKNQTISISLLGIRISVYDAAFLGGMSLFIICIWLYFTMKAANHNIGFLLCDTREQPNVRRMIFHAVSANLLFTSISPSDAPITYLHDYRKEGPKRLMGARRVFNFLFYLPSIAIGVLVLFDILSIFLFKDVYRWPHDALISLHQMTWQDWTIAGCMDLVGVVLIVVTAFIGHMSLEFDRGIASILQQYDALDAPS